MRISPVSDRHIDNVNPRDDRHVRDLLCVAIPDLDGDPLLACLFVDGATVLPTIPSVPDVPASVPYDEAVRVVDTLAQAAVHFSDEPGLVVALKRRGTDAPTDGDLVWMRAARHACAEREVRMLGAWLVTDAAQPLRLDAPTAS